MYEMLIYSNATDDVSEKEAAYRLLDVIHTLITSQMISAFLLEVLRRS